MRYTYTNPLLTREDLSDAYCNFCMKAADNGMNEVLVVSDILEEYIERTIRVIRSIVLPVRN